jgi:hypothetical protein
MTPSQRRVQRLIIDAFEEIRQQVGGIEGRLTDIVLHQPLGNVERLIDWSPLDRLAQQMAEEMLGDLLDAGARTAGATVKAGPPVAPPGGFPAQIAFTFDRKNPRAALWTQQHATALITDLKDKQRAQIVTILTHAQMGGMDGHEAASLIRPMIGLTERDAMAMANVKQRTIDTARSSGATAADARKMGTAAARQYSERALTRRSENIARTEILRAANEGRQQAWAQGVAGGWIDPGSWKQWTTQFDERTCDVCGHMDGAQAPYFEQFPDGDPPLHPSCRCSTFLIPNPEAKFTDIAGLTDEQLASEIDSLLAGRPLSDAPAFDSPMWAKAGAPGENGQHFLGQYERFVRERGLSVDSMYDRSPAMQRYTSMDGYHRMNRALRGLEVPKPEVQRDITALRDEIAAAARAKDDFVVFRGITGQWESLTPGQVLTDPGFQSTTIFPRQAQSFATLGSGREEQTILRIRVPRGTAAVAGDSGDAEVLLQAGTSLQVTGVTDTSYVTYLNEGLTRGGVPQWTLREVTARVVDVVVIPSG